MELAGIRLSENEGEEIRTLAKKIYDLAEAAAYEESSGGKRAVTGDQISSMAKGFINDIEVELKDIIRKEHM